MNDRLVVEYCCPFKDNDNVAFAPLSPTVAPAGDLHVMVLLPFCSVAAVVAATSVPTVHYCH